MPICPKPFDENSLKPEADATLDRAVRATALSCRGASAQGCAKVRCYLDHHWDCCSRVGAQVFLQNTILVTYSSWRHLARTEIMGHAATLYDRDTGTSVISLPSRMRRTPVREASRSGLLPDHGLAGVERSRVSGASLEAISQAKGQPARVNACVLKVFRWMAGRKEFPVSRGSLDLDDRRVCTTFGGEKLRSFMVAM